MSLNKNITCCKNAVKKAKVKTTPQYVYFCVLCINDRLFKNDMEYIIHQYIEHKNVLYKCPHCMGRVAIIKSLIDHNKQHHR